MGGFGYMGSPWNGAIMGVSRASGPCGFGRTEEAGPSGRTRCARRANEHATDIQEERGLPVSYTHLDVYKRQVHIKDIYDLPDDATMADVRIRPIVAVPEGMTVAKLLRTLREGRTKIALAVDEHGGTSGLVTMGDVIAEIIGDFDDEYQHGPSDELVELGHGHCMAPGSYDIDDFAELFGFDGDGFPEYDLSLIHI